MVAHLSALVFPAIIAFYAVPGSSLFSWHPTLMAAGFSLLMLEGVVIFSKSSSLFPNASRPWKASVHYWCMGIGVGLVVAGFTAIFVNKVQKGSDHFTSWHGFLGVITVGYACVQSTGGATAKYYKHLSGFIKIKLSDLKMYHATSGLCLYLLATTSLLLGLQSGWATAVLPLPAWYVCMVCVSVAALVVVSHITTTFLPKEKEATSEGHRPVTRSQKNSN